jgi:hypothetical protein
VSPQHHSAQRDARQPRVLAEELAATLDIVVLVGGARALDGPHGDLRGGAVEGFVRVRGLAADEGL